MRRRRLSNVQSERRSLRARALLRPLSRKRGARRPIGPTNEIWALSPRRPRSAQSLRGVQGRASNTPASRPSSSPKRSKATAWARPARREYRAPDKKMEIEEMRAFRDRFDFPVSDADLDKMPFYKPPEDSPETQYLRDAATRLGSCPAAAPLVERLAVPELAAFEALLEGTGEREISTTMAFVRVLEHDVARQEHRAAHRADRRRRIAHVRHGRAVPPARYLLAGRPALPAARRRAAHVLSRGQAGQILQEGINEAGAISSWIAAATSYSKHDLQMIPFYIFYSMFGFQRIGDLAWAAGDMRTRGFPDRRHFRTHDAQRRGSAARGRHSQLMASFVPNCVLRSDVRVRSRGHHARRFAAHGRRSGGRLLLHHGDERKLPSSGDAGRRGRRASCAACICCATAGNPEERRACSCWARARSCAKCWPRPTCSRRLGVQGDVWSATSFNELRRDGLAAAALEHAASRAKPRAVVRRAVLAAAARVRSSPRPIT